MRQRRHLFEGGVYYFGQYDRATYTASLASSPSNCVVWLLQKLIEKHIKQTTHVRIRTPSVLCARANPPRCLFEGGIYFTQRLQLCGVYSRAASIRGWRLFAEIRYSSLQYMAWRMGGWVGGGGGGGGSAVPVWQPVNAHNTIPLPSPHLPPPLRTPHSPLLPPTFSSVY